MERETKKITTPVDKHEVVVKTWLTAREKRAISAVFLDKAKFSGESKNFDIDGSALNELQDTQIENVVISVNGVQEKVLDLCLDMKDKDYEAVLKAIDEVVNPESSKK